MVIVVVVVVVWVACGFISAGIAKAKNRDAVTYWAAGFFFGIFGIIAALAVPSIKVENLICKYMDTSAGKPKVVPGLKVSLQLIPPTSLMAFPSARRCPPLSP